MASVSEGERRRRFLELLMGAIPEREPLFFPVFVGLMGPRSGGQGEEDPPSSSADRIVLVNPLTQGMVVLRSSGGADLAALVQEMMLAADGGTPRGPPPASKASIEAMRTVERPSGDGGEGGAEEEECAVCLDGLWAADGEVGAGEKGVAVKEMPCRHRFHGRCIEKWLAMHGSCPICRYRMPEEEQPAGKKNGEEREEGEVGGGGRRVAEREIWVTFGFSRRAAEGDQQQQQQEQQPQQHQRQQQQHQEMEEISE